MESRYERERQFHDHSFAEHSRESVDRFYVVARSSREFYKRRLMAACRGTKALEYGCGEGSQSFLLARKGAESVTGIDLSQVAVASATEKARAEDLPNVDFRVMNAEQLEFEDDSFDLVCGSAILHHLDLDNAYSELARVVRPDGRGIFIEPLGHNPLINLYRKVTPQYRTPDEHPLLVSDLKLASGYFGSVHTEFFNLFSLAALPFRRLPGFLGLRKALDAADRALFRLLPVAGRYGWHVVFELSHPEKLP